MIEALILVFSLWFAIVAIMTLLFFGEGTKGIEKEPYYGKKTGTIYTAKKERERHIV